MIVSCPKVSLALDHTVSDDPQLDDLTASFVCFVALLCLFAWVDPLGNWCTSVYFAEQLFIVCTQSCTFYLVWTNQP